MKTLWLVALCVGVSACGETSPEPAERAAPSTRTVGQPATRSQTIGKVKTRNATLIMTSSADGVRFDVEGSDGQLIARGVDEMELRHTSPELFGIYKNAMARSYVDARLDLPHAASRAHQGFDVVR
jgi:hypothetical protein